MNEKKERLFSYLLDSNVHVVFDIDGTLAIYLYGLLRHNACREEDWKGLFKNNNPYEDALAVPQMQRFIQEKCETNPDSIHVCSVAQDFEQDAKLDFVLKNYPTIKRENIHFVKHSVDKINVLRDLKEQAGSEVLIAIVDDTVKTLDMVYEQSDFITVHNSAFMVY